MRRDFFVCVISMLLTLSGQALAQTPKGEPFLPPSGPSRPTSGASTLTKRAHTYEPLILGAAHAHGLEAALVFSVIEVESYFDPGAVSHAGARGLMQLMPVVEREYGVTDVFDPEQNISTGCAYLARLLDAYDGRLTWALAAYNTGPGRVRRAGGPPTHIYVRRVLRARTRWRKRLGTTQANLEASSTPVSMYPSRGDQHE